MKCPKCKKKLQTKRTIDTGTQTKREKFCSKCKITFDTFEMFSEDINNNLNLIQRKQENLVERQRIAYEKYDELHKALNTIVKAGQKK